MTTIESNKLIAEYMDDEWAAEGLKYHSSWDCLMLVIDKIAKNYDVRITYSPTAVDATYINRPDVEDGEIASSGGGTAIENTWNAVVNFIVWYNTKSKFRKERSK